MVYRMPPHGSAWEDQLDGQRDDVRYVDAGDVSPELLRLLSQARRTGLPVAIRQNGETIGAVLSPHDFALLLRQRDNARRELHDTLMEFGKAFEGEDIENIEREVTRAVNEVRGEMRAEREAANADQIRSAPMGAS